MKILKWISWIFVVLAVLLILFSVLSFLINLDTGGINKINYFHAANSFILLAIALYLLTDKFGCCKEKKD